MWGTKRGKQRRQVLVKESRKERGETPPTHTQTHPCFVFFQDFFLLFRLNPKTASQPDDLTRCSNMVRLKDERRLSLTEASNNRSSMFYRSLVS